MKKLPIVIIILVILVISVLTGFIIAFNRSNNNPDTPDDNNTGNDPYNYNLRRSLCTSLNAKWVSSFTDDMAYVITQNSYYYIDKQGINVSGKTYPYSLTDLLPEETPIEEQDSTINLFDLRRFTRSRSLGDLNIYQKDKFGIQRYQNGVLLLKEGGLYNFYNKLGTKVNGLELSYAEQFVDGLALVKSSSGFNYMKPDGSFLSTTFYKDAKTFKDGTAIVSDSRGYFTIDKTGKPLTERRFMFISEFGNNVAGAQLDTYRYVLINKQGVTLSAEYRIVRSVSEDMAVAIDQRNFYYYLDANGKELNLNLDKTKIQINVGYPFREGFALVEMKTVDGGTHFDFIDKTGKFIGKEKFYDPLAFQNGFAVVSSVKTPNYSLYYIDKQGNKINSEEYKSAYSFSSNGLALVKDFDDKFFFIKTDGTTLNNEKYIDAYEFVDGFARVVNEQNQWFLINQAGGKATTTPYLFIGDFFDGAALVQKTDGTYSYINKNLQEITQEKFDSAFSFFDGTGFGVSTRELFLDNTGATFCSN